MGSDETAIIIPGGPRVIDVFDGNGAPSGPNCTLFPGADRLLEASGGRSGGGESPAPHTPSMRQSSAVREPWKPCQAIHGFVGRLVERIGRLWGEARRMRCRRLRTSTSDPRRPRGEVWAMD